MGSVNAELVINGASLEPFPTYRIVTLTAKDSIRRPNPTLSGPSPQRLLVCIQKSTTSKDPIGLEEKLNFLRDGQCNLLHDPSDGNQGGDCQVYFAGCFGEDCDVG